MMDQCLFMIVYACLFVDYLFVFLIIVCEWPPQQHSPPGLLHV